VLAAVVLQVLLPERMVPGSRFLLPGLELGLLAVLVALDPHRMVAERQGLRVAGLTLTALVSLANAWSMVLLVHDLVHRAGVVPDDAAGLLASGAAVWLTNVLAFALWYWELDRGGPAARAHGRRRHPDFLFAQMQTPHLAGPDWEPRFADYLYLSYTNATAFSAADVLPLSRWAKMTMLVQSAVALAVVVLVVARAINVIG